LFRLVKLASPSAKVSAEPLPDLVTIVAIVLHSSKFQIKIMWVALCHPHNID
jgi:hypothetical protein